MQLVSKVSIALTVAIAALSEAKSHGHNLRYRHYPQKGEPSFKTVVPYPVPSDNTKTGSTSAFPTVTGTGIEPTPTYIPTGGNPVTSSAELPAVPSETVTLTYTIGTGTSTTVITTTICRPVTETDLPPAPTGGESVPGGDEELTTTIESTSTKTEVVTVDPATSNAGGVPTSTPGGPSETALCPPPSTVTETATVTVTAPPAPEPTDDETSEVPSQPVPTSSSSSSSSVQPPFPSIPTQTPPYPLPSTTGPHTSKPSSGFITATGRY